MGHGLPPRGEAAGLISEGRKGRKGRGSAAAAGSDVGAGPCWSIPSVVWGWLPAGLQDKNPHVD